MENKTWFITGISSGLGKAIAETVMQKGDFVIGTFRKQSQVTAFNHNNEGKAISYLLDITNHQRIDKLIREIEQKHKKIDVVVNNAGIGFVGAIEESSMEECRSVFEANFFGTLKMTQAVLPLLRKQRKGHIIQISSHGGVKAFAGFGIYNASKFALEGFSEAMAQELYPLNIKVSIVEPGPFRTEFAGDSLGTAHQIIDDYAETSGAFRRKLKSVHGIQEGDPVKAAEAIYQLTKQKEPSLRLPLGKTALLTMSMKVDSLKKDLESNKKLAESVVY